MKYLVFTFLLWPCVSAFSPIVSARAKSSHRLSSEISSSGGVHGDGDIPVDLCIVGGGVSGLAAAIEAASRLPQKGNIILLESNETPGGRVSSDFVNGFTLDRGYAVFVEEYPQSKKILGYDELQLKAYEPGALIKIKNGGFTRVADPLRQPSKLIQALTAKAGKFSDKLRLAPLFYHVKTNSVEDLFDEEEIDTLSCLKEKYKFSEKMIQEFFEPFLVGIYLSPLDQQSSRMFHFVFKMFADGAASLPTGGMQAVSNQMMDRAIGLGVDIHLNQHVEEIAELESGFEVKVGNGESFHSKSVICATESPRAETLLSQLDGMEGLNSGVEEQHQRARSVGCYYYSFLDGDKCPVNDKILILNGEGVDSGPALTVSFLHKINEDYSPNKRGLCSVSIPSTYMAKFKGKENELDGLIRKQLGEWWPDFKDDILDSNTWKLEKTYNIGYAQPHQFGGPFPANVHRGRKATEFRGLNLPKGIFVSGDFMATSTLNGAIESGINAAEAASSFLVPK